MIGRTTNPLLAKLEQQIQKRVPAAKQSGFQRVLTAGAHIMYTGNGHQQMLTQLTKSSDYASNAAEGAAKLFAVMYKQSNKTLPLDLGIPAATVFMCEGLGFVEKAGKLKVTPDVIAAAQKDLSAFIMQVCGVSQDKFKGMMQQGPQGGAAPGAAPAAPAAPAPGGIINSQIGA